MKTKEVMHSFQCPACGHNQDSNTAQCVIPCPVCNYDMQRSREIKEPTMTEQKIEPCPVCTNKVVVIGGIKGMTEVVSCTGLNCKYAVLKPDHEQLCEYVKMGKLVEEFKENPPNTDNDHSCPHGWDLKSIKQGYMLGVQACLDMFKVEGE